MEANHSREQQWICAMKINEVHRAQVGWTNKLFALGLEATGNVVATVPTAKGEDFNWTAQQKRRKPSEKVAQFNSTLVQCWDNLQHKSTQHTQYFSQWHKQLVPIFDFVGEFAVKTSYLISWFHFDLIMISFWSLVQGAFCVGSVGRRTARTHCPCKGTARAPPRATEAAESATWYPAHAGLRCYPQGTRNKNGKIHENGLLSGYAWYGRQRYHAATRIPFCLLGGGEAPLEYWLRNSQVI